MSDLLPELETTIHRAVHGEAEAQGMLLERYRPLLGLMARRSVGPKLAARVAGSDVVQLTFLDALRGFASFQGTTAAEFSHWLTQILNGNLANVIRDHRAQKRDVRREQPFDVADGDSGIVWHEPTANQSTPSRHAIRVEGALQLASLLEKLPAAQEEAVRLRHLEGWSLDEIAQHMNRSPSAVAGLLKRGLKTLRDTSSTAFWS